MVDFSKFWLIGRTGKQLSNFRLAFDRDGIDPRSPEPAVNVLSRQPFRANRRIPNDTGLVDDERNIGCGGDQRPDISRLEPVKPLAASAESVARDGT